MSNGGNHIGKRPTSIWVDRKTCIIVRYSKAIQLSVAQFRAFMIVYSQGIKTKQRRMAISSIDLVNEFYSGVSDPPLYATEVLYQITSKVNGKLAHLGLAMYHTRRKNLSEVRLEEKRT